MISSTNASSPLSESLEQLGYKDCEVRRQFYQKKWKRHLSFLSKQTQRFRRIGKIVINCTSKYFEVLNIFCKKITSKFN